jgi:hypothetical protein
MDKHHKADLNEGSLTGSISMLSLKLKIKKMEMETDSEGEIDSNN